MKIIGFAASTSRNSINKQFVNYLINLFNENNEIELLDLNDYKMPLFSVDDEKEFGFPKTAHELLTKMESADVIFISFAEHNGSYTAAFKNTLDWCSRIKSKFFEDKKLVLLSTSNGVRGASGVLSHALDRLPRHGANILSSFSLPNFETSFSTKKGIIDENSLSGFNDFIDELRKKI
jgi:chromate reductase, NAD(P)H dehydrogenase (quinone)